MAMNLIELVEWLGDAVDHHRANREVAIRQIASQARLTEAGAAELLDNWQRIHEQHPADA